MIPTCPTYIHKYSFELLIGLLNYLWTDFGKLNKLSHLVFQEIPLSSIEATTVSVEIFVVYKFLWFSWYTYFPQKLIHPRTVHPCFFTHTANGSNAFPVSLAQLNISPRLHGLPYLLIHMVTPHNGIAAVTCAILMILQKFVRFYVAKYISLIEYRVTGYSCWQLGIQYWPPVL